MRTGLAARVPAAALALAAALGLAVALALGGCGEGITVGSGPPQVVAAESMWGSIATQLAGADAHVQSIITDPAEDPHAYEPTAADARGMATAGLVIVNGTGYDPWASHLLAAEPTPGRITLDVGRLLHVPGGGNPHRWYDPADVEAVASRIAAALSALDPRHRAAYHSRLAQFDSRGLAVYHRWIAFIHRRYAGTPVGASESIFALLAPALGLRLITPPGFMTAISEGSEVSAGDVASTSRQAQSHAIRVWVYNTQNATPEVARLTALARASGIPVTTITETVSSQGASFASWQVAELQALARALHEATGR
jgi:zinc/manganese transport system substrate-binding protein